jgi:hypothetical protein
MIPDINKYTNFTTDDNQHIAIACGKTNRGNNHTGLLIKHEAATKMLHFGWHKQLHFNDELEFFDTLCWLNFDYFSPDNDPLGLNKEQLIVWAYSVFEESKNFPIPYGINYFGDYFGLEDKRIHLTADTVGLTCATFLVAFFSGYGLDLIHYKEWPSRPDDATKQEEIVSTMYKTGVPETHIEKVAAEQVKARFLPEEITASSACTGLPAGFAYCEELGSRINNVLHS